MKTEPLEALQNRLKEYDFSVSINPAEGTGSGLLAPVGKPPLEARLRVPRHGDMWTGSRWIALPFTCTCGVEITNVAGFAREHADHFTAENP